MSEARDDRRSGIHRLNVVGFSAIAVMIGGFGVWASTGEMAGAVIASGTVVVESNIKKVQHPSGGIVGEILIKEGALVQAGDVVMRLDDTLTRATLGMVRSQLDELRVREVRLLGERDGGNLLVFPLDLSSRRDEVSLATALTGEQRLFESRLNTRKGQQSQLRERISQSREENRGQTAQQVAKESEIAFVDEELAGVRDLWKKGLVSITRLMALQRDKARLEGERGLLVAESARTRGKISEIELQIIQLDIDFRTEVLKDLREVQGKIAELRERFIAAEDQLKRVDIRATQAGIVHSLAVHTVGGVITGGETVMQIVPVSDALVIDAKVAPNDIDQVVPGAPTIIRIMAGNQRTMPDIQGVLIRVSADLTHEPAAAGQTALHYYAVRIAIPKNEIERLGDLRLVPGMPAEAFIQTNSRTVLQYLLKPLRDQFARALTER